jgi:hypothetical protein
MGQEEVVRRRLYPLQLGVGVRGATELIGRSTEFFLSQGEALLQLDLRNAFNTVSRSHMLSCVRKHAPAFAPWADFLYSYPIPLLLENGDFLLSEEGCNRATLWAPFSFRSRHYPSRSASKTSPV